MSTIVDAQGLSCPHPVLMTLEEIKKAKKGEFVVLVDTDTSKENITRAIESEGWEVRNVQPEGVGYRITIGRD